MLLPCCSRVCTVGTVVLLGGKPRVPSLHTIWEGVEAWCMRQCLTLSIFCFICP